MLPVIRLTTVHPALVHFTIGAVPIVVIAYAVGAAKRDDRWTFAGDVATVITAALSIATIAFGAVSNWMLDWPGSLETFRWWHVGLGIASTVFLCAFAIYRIQKRRHHEGGAGFGTVAVTGLVALGVLVTGWIGGEVLVFRSGMAVVAAGEGAVAQPTTTKPPHPRDVPEAMDAVQAAWGCANASIAGMIVRQPEPKAYSDVERSARELGDVARWMATDGTKRVRDNPDAFAELSRTLEQRAGDLAVAAHASDIGRVTEAVGGVQKACADCHAETRWHHAETVQASR